MRQSTSIYNFQSVPGYVFGLIQLFSARRPMALWQM